MDNARMSFGSLGNGAHEGTESKKRVIKATISKLTSNNSLGFVCTIGQNGGAEKGHLSVSPLGSSTWRGLGCTGASRCPWRVFGWFGICVCLK